MNIVVDVMSGWMVQVPLSWLLFFPCARLCVRDGDANDWNNHSNVTPFTAYLALVTQFYTQSSIFLRASQNVLFVVLQDDSVMPEAVMQPSKSIVNWSVSGDATAHACIQFIFSVGSVWFLIRNNLTMRSIDHDVSRLDNSLFGFTMIHHSITTFVVVCLSHKTIWARPLCCVKRFEIHTVWGKQPFVRWCCPCWVLRRKHLNCGSWENWNHKKWVKQHNMCVSLTDQRESMRLPHSRESAPLTPLHLLLLSCAPFILNLFFSYLSELPPRLK